MLDRVRIGDRVLEARAPWTGAWVVTDLRVRPGRAGESWLSITYTQYGIRSVSSTERLVAAPEGWEDPPKRPLSKRLLRPEDYGVWERQLEDDPEYQAALADFRQRYADWAERFLPSLGLAEHARLARQLVDSLEMEKT